MNIEKFTGPKVCYADYYSLGSSPSFISIWSNKQCGNVVGVGGGVGGWGGGWKGKHAELLALQRDESHALKN